MYLKRGYFLSIFNARFFIGVSALLLFWAGYWQWLAYHAFLQTPVTIVEPTIQIAVERGDSLSRLARKLEKQNIISNRYYFRLAAELNPEFKQIKRGEYRLTRADTPQRLLEKFSSGKVIQYAFTIVEGSNSFQILEQLKNDARIKFDLPDDPAAIASQINLQNQHIEGWLYPDTYYFVRGEKASDLLKRAVAAMRQVLSDEWSRRAPDLPYKSAYQALIMASIIEKETALASERDKIAGVFVRRLAKNMRLQTDPTVIYGIGPKFNGDITYKDLRTLTPYNTYKIKGLPPTPIASAGRAAINAALNPAEGDALYFVATGDGGHQFSATLKAHNKALKEYLKKQKKRQR